MWCAPLNSSPPSPTVSSLGDCERGRYPWRGRSAGVALVIPGLALLLGPSACGKGPDGRAKRLSRDKDASAVLVVDSPQEQIVTFSNEAEPNNDVSQATTLALATGAKGSLDGVTDVDVYAIVVPELGLLDARLSGIDGVDLILELRDSAGNALARSDRGPALTVEGLPNYPVTAQTYYLAVSEFVKKSRRRKKKNPPAGREGPSPIYELSVRHLPDSGDGHEAEPNESVETATELVIGDSALGYLGWARDVDVWKLSTEGFAAEYSLDLDVSAVPGITPSLAIVDGDGKVMVRRTGIKGRGLSVRNLVVASEPAEDGSVDDKNADTNPRREEPAPGEDDDAGQFLYLELRARRSNPIESYRLSAATRLLDLGDEAEPNDKSARPGVLRDDPSASEGTRRGHLTIGDVDYYQLAASDSPVLLSVTAKPAGDANIELTILIDGQIAAMADEGKARAAESLPDTRIEAGKSALVKIAGRGSLEAQAAYELRWAVDPAGPAAAPGEPGTEPGTEPEGDDPGLLDDYEDE